MPKVSVIIPVYNVEPYLRECLDCAVNQTLEDIEIICVNDGSTDGSGRILEEYAALDCRIRIVTQENKGLSGARNSGMTMAKGEYLYFFDSDDRMELNAMESLYDQACTNLLDIVHFDAEPFYEYENLRVTYPQYRNLYKRKKEYSQIVSGSELFLKMKQDNSFVCSACCYFFRRGFLEKNQIKFYEGILHEDELFSFQALLHAERVKHVRHAYFYRRIRQDSIMTKPKSIKNVSGYANCVINMLITIQKLSLNEDILDMAINHIAAFMQRIQNLYNQLPDSQKLDSMLKGNDLIFAKLLNALQSTSKKKTNSVIESIIIPSKKERRILRGAKASDEPMISVVVLEKNDVLSPKKCIDSLINQTLNDIEIIYVKNRMSKYTISELSNYAKQDTRFRIIDEDITEYMDLIEAGIKNSRGKYVGFITSNDYVETDMYEILYAIAEANQLDMIKTDLIEFCCEKKETQNQIAILSKAELYERIIHSSTIREIYLANVPFVGGIYGKRFVEYICSIIPISFHKSVFLNSILTLQALLLADKLCFVKRPFYLYCKSTFIDNPCEVKSIYEEYSAIHNLFFQNPENKDFYVPIFIKKRHDAYMKAYMQIDPAYQLHFLRQYCDELRESQRRNELNLSLLSPGEKQNVNEILNSPERYYFSKCSCSYSDKLKKDFEIAHNRLEQVRNEIFAWQAIKNREKRKADIKVSVIIPVYNAAEYLEECLQSVLKQTLKEIEIICIDDGSTDMSLNILWHFAQLDSRIIILSQTNSGSAKARNKGLAVATGEFVAFMDADDWYPTDDVLQVLYDSAKENDVKICGGGRVLQEKTFQPMPDNFKEDKLYLFEEQQFDWGYQSFIFDRMMLRDNQIDFPDYLRYQDPPFFLRAMVTAKKFFALRKICYCYRRGHQSIKWTERRTCDLLKGLIDELVISKQYGLSKIFAVVTERINKNYSDIFVNGCIGGSVEVLRLLYKANDIINEASLQPEDFPVFVPITLSPIKQVVAALSNKQASLPASQHSKKLLKQVKDLTNELKATRHSFSYRIGRAITFPLRKLRTFIRIWKREGLKLSIKLTLKKIRQIPSILKEF